jgi:citrate synthase
MPEFSPGLEGVVAAQTEISEVDGQGGRLIYRGGYLISDLYDTCRFEEVAYLLWNGRLPDEEELREVKGKLASRRTLTEAARAVLEAMPRGIDPMDVLRTVVSAQGAAKEIRKPSLDEAISYAACFPTIVAATYRKEQGEAPLEPRRDLGHAANFLYMLSGKEPEPSRARYLESYLLLLADHGMNASTFTARVIASTNSDLTSCLVGAIGALKGPAHGGAATAAMNMLEKIGTAENAEPWLGAAMERKERFMGFGHRVYRTYDPRAKILRELAKEANPEFFAVASVAEEVALRLLHEKHPERPNATNVDYYSAGVLAGAGIPKEYFTCIFAISRVVGWTAHVLEFIENPRLIRPASQWMGPEPSDADKPRPLAERQKAAAR